MRGDAVLKTRPFGQHCLHCAQIQGLHVGAYLSQYVVPYLYSATSINNKHKQKDNKMGIQVVFSFPGTLPSSTAITTTMPRVQTPRVAKYARFDAKVWLRLVSESLADFSFSKSNLSLLCPWPGCGISIKRDPELERHILSLHLPDNLYCPGPACPWRGHREDARKKHIGSGKCGPTPEWEEQRKIYEPSLIISWVLDAAISTEVAEMYALDLVKERARELEKTNLWKDLKRCDRMISGD